MALQSSQHATANSNALKALRKLAQGCSHNVRAALGKQAIPTELKTLTSSEKLSVKPMPKSRFHEIYQDYLCGCVLRVARELFALFPVDTVLATAVVDSPDSWTGRKMELPVLSVAMPRAVIARLDFNRLDPSAAMENFRPCGDFKASRKSEAFQPITPQTPDDLATVSADDLDFSELVGCIKTLRAEFKTKIAELSQRADPAILLPDSVP